MSYYQWFIFALLLGFNCSELIAQCNTGSEPECTCGTAPVLCTVDQLDNYMFSMSTFQHPADGPSPLCPPGQGGGGSVSNNPTWFAFTAWCTDLTLDVSLANCTQVGNFIGVQIAIYDDCSLSNAVACDVNPGSCSTAGRTLSMSGLTIGGVYYFIVDGCAGSACDVTIDVVGTCGAEMIAPWTLPIMGELNPCAGDTETYTSEIPLGAATYHWYVDNVLISQTNTPSFNYTWPAAGTYQLCVDASNDPCVPVTDPPPPLCTTITVIDADAGDIMVTPQLLCPNEIANITVTNFTTGPDNSQDIFITDDNGVIVEVIPGSSGTFTSAVCGVFVVYSYNYNSNAGTPPVVGNNANSIDCSVECCDLESAALIFQDNVNPTFPNPPPDENLDCADLLTPMMDLGWDDNCDGIGMVPGMETGSADNCNGGTITREWTYTDGCGNTATHTQTITVMPTAPPTFTNPPADQSFNCENIPSSAPDLNYTNNGAGACLISGTVSAVQSGTADICGGTITYTWSVTDACSNTITHVQNITIIPAPAPDFLNPPADQTVDCDNIPTSAADLSYTNSASGVCLISGTITPVQSGTADICGGTITYTWDFTDQCNNNINHVQNFTVTPATVPAFVNPPADMTVSCENIPTGASDLSYTNNGLGNCLISGTVPVVTSGTADVCGGILTNTWEVTDQCSNTITHSQRIIVDPAPAAAFINPPTDMTVSCENVPTSAADLSYSNNGIGACLISGSVPAVQSGSGDICGGTIVFTWTFTDACNNTISHVQNINITPADPVVFINPPADQTVDCSNIPTSAPDLNYTNNETGACLISGSVAAVQSGTADACGGVISFTWTFTDQCNNNIQHVQNYTINPAPPAAFTGVLPTDITVACNAVPSTPPPLPYSNNESGVCLISGNQPATQVGAYSACGGSFQYVWEFTDACGRTITHTQNVSVDPAPAAAFVNPPGPITLNCSSVPVTPPTLNFTNGASGVCNISGTVPAIQSGSYNSCGGNIIYTWTFTDACNRNISHSQNVQVSPASDPVFVNPPADITIACGVSFPDPYALTYTNSETGDCEIMGSVISTVTFSGLDAFYSWFFTNPCNNATITHSQTITQTAIPAIIINPQQVTICQSEFFDLSTIVVTDQNNTNPNITYHSATPANVGNQLPSPLVNPSVTTTYYILASNSAGCSDEAGFDVIVEPPPFAGMDGTGVVCFVQSSNVNLFDYLMGGPDMNGFWQDTYLYGVDVTNPFNVDLSLLPAGTYTFDYFLPSGGVCPDDMASVTITTLEEIFIEVSDIGCSADPNFYEVTIVTFGFDVTALAGNYMDLGGGMAIVTDIPIGTLLLLGFSNPGYPQCIEYFPVVPPDCDCPIVDPPVNDGDAEICEGENNPELSVTVGVDETANWFDAASGGTLLIAGSTVYTSTETAPGTYTYYVQAENINDGCVSSLLTPVNFTIHPNPTGNMAALSLCDTDGDGFEIFDLSLADDLINADPGFTYTYFGNMTDAQSNMNPLPNNYTNTSTPTQTIYALITTQENCTAIVPLELIVLPQPIIALQINHETCLGDGDGSVTINAPTAVNFSLDGTTWTTNNIFNNLIPGSYTAYVEDVEGCLAQEDFTINPGLELILAAFNIVCENNGTASDATDDFYTITFSVTNNNSNSGTYTLSDVAMTYGSYNYNENNSITIPALDQSLLLNFADDLLACFIEQPIGPLNACSTDCTITIDQLDISCSDNGTSSDATDDFYTVTINASAINGAANNTYNVLINGTLNYNFPYNTISTFNIPADGGSPIITVVDNADAQCQSAQTIGPLTPCSDACIIQIDALNFTCDNNGTITDPTDDFYTITIEASAINPGANQSFEVFADAVSQGIFTYSAGASFTLPADGSTVQILIQDADDAMCSASQSIGPLDPCAVSCTINATVSNIVCDDNGTGNDATDDTFTFDVLVNGQNTGTSWESTDGTLTGNYGIVENFGPYLINGGDLNFDLQDLITSTCQTNISITAPAPCSDACIISIDQLNIICNDNGTTTDPADDFYTITIEASAINPGTSLSFEVFTNAISQGIFTYSAGATFTLPADGSTVQIMIQDSNEPLCSASQSIGPLDPCAVTCTINASVSNIICDDNGTGNDATDDTFTFDVLVNGQNTGVGWESTDGTLSGSYGVVENFGPYLISGGDLNFDLQDLITSTCETNISITAPAPCSDACIISIDQLNIICDDNGTTTDPADDFYAITIEASAINPGASQSFEVFTNAISLGIFAYSAGATFTLPADGSTVQILIQDADDAMCSASQSIGPLDSCAVTCTINATVSNIICDDNGTGNDATDDTFTFDVLVNGQNTGTGWESTDGTLTGNYGIVQNFGPYLIIGGDLSFDLQDLTTSTCETNISITAPAPCSDACIISIDQLNIICDDNGTTTDPTDDFYTITIEASAINPGTSLSFEVLTNAISQGIFTYSAGATFTLPADGSTVQILIQDADDAMCSASQSIGPLDPCAVTCTINATVSNIICDDNGTGNDTTDDTFTFDLLVNGQNTGTGWESMDGTLSGSYGVVENFGPYLISGGDLSFYLQDLTTTTCQTNISIVAPASCSDPCIITIDQLNSNCNNNGTSTDPTDDFYTITIMASAINSGVSQGFEVFADAVSQGIFMYFAGATLTLPADGSTVQIMIQDSNEPLCSASQSIGPLDPCAVTCTINASVSNIICDDNGTGNDATDDTFTFDVLVNGQNTGVGWESTDGTLSGSYGAVENFGPYLISGGDLNFDLQDLTTSSCLVNVNISAPMACSNCPQSVDAGGAGWITCNTPFIQLSGTSSEPGIYSWTGPNSFTSNNLMDSSNVAGWYFLTAIYADNCIAVDSVEIPINIDEPVADAGPDQIITCDEMLVTLDGSGSTGNGLIYSWINDTGSMVWFQQSIMTGAAGIYTLEVTDIINGCSSSDQVEVIDSTGLPTAFIYANPAVTLDCIVTSIVLSSDNQPNVIYSWNGIVMPTITVNEPGTFDLIAIDTITGCENDNSIVINDIQDYPLVDLDAVDPLSCENEEITINGSGSQTGPNIVYNWYDAFNNLIPGENGNMLTVEVGGYYYLELVDTLNGCENIDSVFVDGLFNTPLSDNVEDITLYCGESSTNLNVNILGSMDNILINWDTQDGVVLSGSNDLTPLVDGAGTYNVSLIDTTSGCLVEDSLEVFVNDNYPELLLAEVVDENCFGAQNGLIDITNISGGEGPFNYALNGVNFGENDSYPDLLPGNYNLVLTDDNGCTLDTSFVVAPGVDLELDLPLTLELVEDQFGTIAAVINVPEEDLASISWNPPGTLSCDSCLITNILAVDNETYQLIILHNNGCLAIAEIRVLVRDKASIYIPNVFTPNGDGLNDIFTVFANEEVQEVLEMSIFDRWGEYVFRGENFQPNNLNFGWDGQLRGKNLNPAVFVYMIQVRLKDGSTEFFSGDVTLIR